MKNLTRHSPPAKIKNKIITVINNIHKPMTNPMEHGVSSGSIANYLNICSLSLQFGLAKMIKIIYNDNTPCHFSPLAEILGSIEL